MASKLSEEFKIPGFGVSKTLNLVNKIKMKEIMVKNKIPTHLYKKIEKSQIKQNLEDYIKYLEEEISYPMFIKPSESFGSNGTKKITNKKELKKSLKEIKEDEIEYEIDEFVSNTILSCDAVIINKKIRYFRTRLIIGQLHNFKNGKTYATCITPPNHQEYKKGLKMTKKIVSAYEGIFGNKCVNFEFIKKNQQDLLFLELNYRRPGAKACYVFDFSHRNGFNFEALDLDLTFGSEKIEIYDDDFESDYEFYAGSVVFPGLKDSVVTKVRELPEGLSSEVRPFFKLEVGDFIRKSKDGYCIPCFIIIRNKCFSKLYSEIQRLCSWYPYEFE